MITGADDPTRRPGGGPPGPGAGAALRAAAEAYLRAAALDPQAAPHAEACLQVQGELGRGGMGVVYRVLDRRLGRVAALKVLPPGADERSVRRFQREARVTARLDHPGVPPVYEAGLGASGQRYLLLRLIEGRTLAELFQDCRAGRARLRDGIEALARMSETVAYAHAQGVVHRDLKPANVIVGRYGEVIVLDWGLARVEGLEEPEGPPSAGPPSALAHTLRTANFAASQGPDLTQEGAVMGTPGYLAPEQAEGQTAGPQADVFALGASLCVALTGQVPVAGSSALERISALVQGKVRRPRELDPRAPVELDALAAAALALDPAARPDAARFVTELRAWLAGEPVSFHRAGPGERLLRAVRRRPARALAAALGALLLAAVGGGLALLQRAEARREQTRLELERAEADKRRLAAETAAGEAERALAETERARAEDARRAAEEVSSGVVRALEELSRAETQARTGAIGDLERSLAVVTSTCGSSPGVVLRVARVWASAGRRDKAVQVAEEVIARAPETWDAYQLLLELAPERSQRWMDELVLRAGVRGETNPYVLLVRALSYRQRGELVQARAECDAAVALAPRLAWAYQVRGPLRFEAGDVAGALQDLDLAVSLEPFSGLAIFNRGIVRLRTRDLAGAATDFDHAIELSADRPEYHYYRAQVALARDDVVRGEASLARALTLGLADREQRALALANLGQLRYELGRPQEAWENYRQAMELEPDPPARILVGRAEVRAELGDLAGARQDLERARAREPGLLEVEGELAFLDLRQGRFEAAARGLERFVAHPRAAVGQAIIARVVGASVPRLEQVAGGSDWDALKARWALGRAETGELLTAARVVPELRAIRECEAWGLLGLAAERRGDLATARECYRACLGRQQDDQLEHQLARMRLAALEKR